MYTKITAPFEGVEKNRWLDGLTNEQHHAMKCISSSSVKFRNSGPAAVSPKTFYSHCILKEKSEFEQNDAFRIGTIAHLAVLEPERFEKSVVVCDLNQNTNDFKNFKMEIAKDSNPSLAFQEQEDDKKLANEIEELRSKLRYFMDLCPENDPQIEKISSELEILIENQKIIEENKQKNSKKKSRPKIKDEDYIIKYTKDGGILTEKGNEIFIVKSEEMKMYRAFQSQVEKHPRISFLMQDCIFEQSGIAQDPITGLWLSVRGDARNPRGYFLDPKTMADYLSVKSIEKYFTDYNLALQDGAYTYTANLIEPGIYKKFFFIMMSKKAPYEIALVQLDQDDRLYGMNKFKQILQSISECELSGKWPSLDAVDGNHGLTIKLPPWSRK